MNNLSDYLRKRGRQTQLAKDIGVSPGYLSDVANGKKPGSLKLFRSISEATGIPLGSLMQGKEEAPLSRSPDPQAKNRGFSEADAEPFHPASTETARRAEDLAQHLAPDSRHRMLFIAQRDFPVFSILKGDLLIIGSPPSVQQGDLVIASLSDGNLHDARTVIRQRMGDALVPPHSGRAADENHVSQAILGTVLAVVRSPAYA